MQNELITDSKNSEESEDGIVFMPPPFLSNGRLDAALSSPQSHYDWTMSDPSVPRLMRAARPTLRQRSSTLSNTLGPEVRLPQLPVELLDMIFAHMRPSQLESTGYYTTQPGRQDLRACHSVCCSWRDAVRPHLFHDLMTTFIPDASVDHPWEMVDVEDNMNILQLKRRERIRTLGMLLSFLDRSPHIASHVRRLWLRCRIRSDMHHEDLPFPRDLRADPTALLSVLGSLPRLRVLHLRNVALTDLPAPEAEQHLCAPLRRLQIDYVCKGGYWLMPDLEITQLLACFTRVEELHITGSGKWRNRASRDDYSGPARLRLDSLVLQRVYNGGVLFKHLLHSDLTTLSCLVLRRIGLLENEDLTLFNDFLREVGPQLCVFHIYLQHNHIRYGTQVVDITPCRNIKELTIGFTLPIFVDAQCNRVLEDAARLIPLAYLTRETYPELESFTLEITFDAKTFRNVSDPTENWIARCRGLGALDEALAAAAEHCGLRGIWFEHSTLGQVDGRKSIERMFPRLRRNQKLLFRSVREGIWQKYD